MRARRLPLVLASAGAVLALAACSGGATPGGSASPVVTSGAPGTASPSAPPSASPSASPSPSLETLPPKDCLTRTWTLLRFVAMSDQTYGTGEGGDVTVAFAGGGYTLAGAGTKPIALTLAGSTAQLVVDGRATGTDKLAGTTATFTTDETSGSGKLSAAGRTEQLTMKQVNSVIGLEGKGEVACTAKAMTITFPTVRLELART